MPREAKTITRDDIMPMAEFGPQRKEMRAGLLPAKKKRRVEVGPHATFYFENYDTMWLQVHEMLYIEKGGEEQIEDELSAYNPLIPQGRDLSCTMMFEIEDKRRREAILARLGGVEETMYIQIGEERVMADWEHDVDRTTPDGKTSSVHFLHFHFTDAQVEKFKDPSVQVLLGVDHREYAHITVLRPEVRDELVRDFD